MQPMFGIVWKVCIMLEQIHGIYNTELYGIGISVAFAPKSCIWYVTISEIYF